MSADGPSAAAQAGMSSATSTSSRQAVASSSGSAASRSSPATTTTTAATQPLHTTLPSPETQRHITEARAAVVASIGNMLDSELQSRASILHENATALSKQEQDVLKATDGLRVEREKLAREADLAAKRLKEIGNVQNWAEVVERGFVLVEETLRLANGGGSEGSYSGSDTASVCSCSECGREGPGDDAAESDEHMDVDPEMQDGKGKTVEVDGDTMMHSDAEHGTMSDASRTLLEPESSNGTGMAKNSETASIATNE